MPKKYPKELINKAYNLINKEGYSLSKACEILEVDRHTMSKRLKENFEDVKIFKDGKKEVDSNYFEVIDTEEKAYWLGFLTADGYVSSKNDIELALKASDKCHLESFKKAIKSNHKIGRKEVKLNNKIHIAYRINIRDTKMSNDLKKLGFNNEKSYNAYIPFDFIPDDLLPHYMRGLMDGDGCIVERKGGLNVTIACTKSEQLKNDIIKIFKDILDIDVHIKTDARNGLYDIRIYDKKEISRYFNWIYKNATVYLQRKYNKFAVLRQDRKKS